MPRLMLRAVALAPTVLLSGALFGAAHAADVTRLPLANNNDFPIAAAVTIPAGFDTVYVSGTLPVLVNQDAPKGSVEAYGDMETQTVSVLTQIKATLARMGLGMGDVVKMTVFMSADPKSCSERDARPLVGCKELYKPRHGLLSSPGAKVTAANWPKL